VSLSVVVACLNAASTLPEQLDALSQQTFSGPWQLVVADNGSTDGSAEIVRSYSDRIDLIVVDAPARRNVAYPRNRGVEAATGDRLVFVDADDVVHPDFLATMADALEQHELVAAQGEVAKLNEPWTRVRTEFVEVPTLPFPPHLPFGSSFGLGVHRRLHEEVGGFDEDMRSLEDVDYCVRLQLAGAELHHEPRAVVHYRYRRTLPGIFEQASIYAEEFARIEKRYGTGSSRSLVTWPLRGWRGIALALPGASRKAGRARLAWQAGWQLGRLRGSVRHRVVAG